MPGLTDRYPCIAAPSSIEDFDAALGGVMSDRLGGFVTAAQAVALEEAIRTRREEYIMRHGG